jgi:GAF domain-containing protein
LYTGKIQFMKPPPFPANEAERLQSLRDHQLLDSLPEEVYDDITHIASEICGTPIASLTLVDENRLWFKSRQGLDVTEIPREFSFCTYTIMNPDEVMVVPDARFDERFHESPTVTNGPKILFYAGVPVKSSDGFPFGSICVMDNRPRTLPEEKIESLKALAKLVGVHFELRKIRIELEKSRAAMRTAESLTTRMRKGVDALDSMNLPPQQQQHVHTIRQALESLGPAGFTPSEKTR